MRLSGVAVALVIASACGGGEDAERVRRLEAEVARMQDEITELRKELLYQDANRRGDPAEATIPPECVAYLKAVEVYLECDKLPPAAAEATRRSVEMTKATWRPPMPDDAVRVAAAACRAGLDAIATAAGVLDCPFAERGP